jgi:hypothetical protein
MVLRVTARLAQRLGTITPSQVSCTAKSGLTGLRAAFALAQGAIATRCKAKCGVLDTVWPLMTAANCALVVILCKVSLQNARLKRLQSLPDNGLAN